MRTLSVLFLSILSVAWLSGKEKPPTTYTIPLPPKPDFSALRWLLGDWIGKTTEHSPQGEIHISVSLALDQRFILFREEISLAATKAAPASKESWLGILSAGTNNAGFVLRVFSSTGFITRNRVTIKGDEIHFNPEGGEQPPPGWLFRRVLERSGDGGLNEAVQAAPPDRPFFEYYSATLTRTSASTEK